MLRIRAFEPEDIATLMQMGQAMHEESSYNGRLRLNADKMVELVWALRTFDNYCCYVATKGDEIVGMFVGATFSHFFTKDEVATDLILYVKPEHRGTSAAVRLLKAFEAWAAQRGCRETWIGVSTGVHPERTGALLERVGYAPFARSYYKALPNVQHVQAEDLGTEAAGTSGVRPGCED